MRSPTRSTGSARSALLKTTSSGMFSTPSMSARTWRTALIWPTGSGWAASTTCRIRSAWATSSRVERKASISSWGRLRTKPTVSVRVYTRPSGVLARRTVGSRVANRASCTMIWAPVMAFSSEDLPALVYPAIATEAMAPRWREPRLVSRAGAMALISRRSLAMRSRMRRRSSSILVSPGPREPIP